MLVAVLNMPVQGLQRSQLLALGAVVIYQLVLLDQHERNLFAYQCCREQRGQRMVRADTLQDCPRMAQ
jgi:hypothetical protein